MSARRVVVVGPTRPRVQHRHLVLDVTGTAALRHDLTQEHGLLNLSNEEARQLRDDLTLGTEGGGRPLSTGTPANDWHLA